MTKYSGSPEGVLTSHIIEHYQDQVENGDLYDRIETLEPEAHYNHYGDRGVADLYVELVSEYGGKEYHEGKVFEVKADNAVEEAKGAEDIIRQFNRMSRYFFQDSSWEKPGHVHYELSFIPTPATLRHIEENRTLYRQTKNFEQDKAVLFRAPEGNFRPGLVFLEEWDTAAESLADSRPEYARLAGVDEETIDRVKS